MENSTAERKLLLKDHFKHHYELMAASGIATIARIVRRNDTLTALSGVPYPLFNAVWGISGDGTAGIGEWLRYFQRANMPFVWYVDAGASPQFSQELVHAGFQSAGTFRGMYRSLEASVPDPELPAGYAIERIRDEGTFQIFHELLCKVFDIAGHAKRGFGEFQWRATDKPQPDLTHWLVTHQGHPVSTLSLLVQGGQASVWNATTAPAHRGKGVNTALWRTALRDAQGRGCDVGATYLLADGMAFGICQKLGYNSEWLFEAYIAPITYVPATVV